ncbi:DUF4339 domain-containing protein [Chlamydiia bacterium]|nr:DUF4339 domain-containing protein [Chlamydiia bacterium]
MVLVFNTTVVFLITVLWAVVTQRNLFLWGVLVYNFPYYVLFFPIYDLITFLMEILVRRSIEVKDSELWFYMDKKANEFGPVKLIRIKELITNKKISKNTYVRSVDSQDWVTAMDIL